MSDTPQANPNAATASTAPASSPGDSPAKPAGPRRIIWVNVLTVVSAAILIAVEVFGAAFAAGWAFAMLFNLGDYGVPILQAVFFAIGVVAMARFLRNARRIEPFTLRR